ncbi:extracellular solute-binding protein [Paenibacillus contaminans]|uniref:ABC transporter substrate-binding protein n=1 Tax=Paenibacillus contaminans TaxID=450362 RepID=A0A329LVC1_9BACL|nr:extracellular solute-binding protein [Paenibacillus contaminans]RAV11901.1 ABC transporter substrate-binding protein [Paenibacillus contaminans]
MNKKLTTSLLILAVAASAAGCSSGGNQGGSQTSSPSPSGGAASKQPDTDKPKPVLRELLPYNRYDPNDNPVTNYLKEATGYTVKYNMLPVENADEKLNLLMANQESYDFMKLNAGQFAQLASSGALEPLNELIDKYGPNMKRVISKGSWNGATMKDQILAIPELAGSGITAGYSMVYRQDWLDELKLQVPTTLEELVNVLREIKAKKKVIPLSGGKDPIQGEIGAAMGWLYGVANQMKVEGGKIIHLAEDPKTVEYLTFMNQLYTEGLIDPEWAINQPNTLIERFTSGQSFMYREGWWNGASITDALASKSPDAKIGILPPLKDASGAAHASASGGIGFFIGIPKWAPNKEETIKYLDKKFEEEIFKHLSLGQEGKHYKVEDGKYYPILPVFEEEWNFAGELLTGIDEEKYPVYWQARVRKNPVVQNYFETFQKNAKGITYNDALMFAPPIPEVSKNKQKLAKFTEDEFIKFITGAKPINQYDKFLQQWKADGGEEMMKAANSWYATVK